MRTPTFDQEMIARNYWSTIEESHQIGKSRHKRNVFYRHAFFVACREVTQLSLATIGKMLNKDHATVIHALRGHEMNYRFDTQYRNIYTEIYSCLNDLIVDNTEKVYEVIKNKANNINAEAFNDHLVQMYKQKFERQEDHYKAKLEPLNAELNKLRKHNKQLQKRVDDLNNECLRLKNLL